MKKKPQRTPEDIDDLLQCLDHLEDLVPATEDVNEDVIYDAQDLMKMIKDARLEAQTLQKVIDDQKEEISELEDRVDELENEVEPIRNRFNALTDRSNWDGNTWRPVLWSMEHDVVDFIERGRAPLHENQS